MCVWEALKWDIWEWLEFWLLVLLLPTDMKIFLNKPQNDANSYKPQGNDWMGKEQNGLQEKLISHYDERQRATAAEGEGAADGWVSGKWARWEEPIGKVAKSIKKTIGKGGLDGGGWVERKQQEEEKKKKTIKLFLKFATGCKFQGKAEKRQQRKKEKKKVSLANDSPIWWSSFPPPTSPFLSSFSPSPFLKQPFNDSPLREEEEPAKREKAKNLNQVKGIHLFHPLNSSLASMLHSIFSRLLLLLYCLSSKHLSMTIKHGSYATPSPLHQWKKLFLFINIYLQMNTRIARNECILRGKGESIVGTRRDKGQCK